MVSADGGSHSALFLKLPRWIVNIINKSFVHEQLHAFGYGLMSSPHQEEFNVYAYPYIRGEECPRETKLPGLTS